MKLRFSWLRIGFPAGLLLVGCLSSEEAARFDPGSGQGKWIQVAILSNDSLLPIEPADQVLGIERSGDTTFGILSDGRCHQRVPRYFGNELPESDFVPDGPDGMTLTLSNHAGRGAVYHRVKAFESDSICPESRLSYHIDVINTRPGTAEMLERGGDFTVNLEYGVDPPPPDWDRIAWSVWLTRGTDSNLLGAVRYSQLVPGFGPSTTLSTGSYVDWYIEASGGGREPLGIRYSLDYVAASGASIRMGVSKPVVYRNFNW